MRAACSPYKRSKQTYEEITRAFDPKHLVGCQEEVQLREQDFGSPPAPRPAHIRAT